MKTTKTVISGLFFSLPTTLQAEVCDKERPLWDGGPVSAAEEALHYLTSPIAWPLLALLILALLFQRRALWIACAIYAALLAWAAVKLPQIDDLATYITTLMQQEGCIGSPHLSIGICAAISITTLSLALTRRKTKKDKTCSKD